MAHFKIEWLEVKSPEWKIVSLTNAQGTQEMNVSLNKKDKKGREFPNFDNLKAGDEVDGEFWKSPTGKGYLYPPEPAKGQYVSQGGSQGRTGAIGKAMETKAQNIEKAQDNKNLGIKSASTIRMAVDMTIASIKNEDIIDPSVLKGIIREWRAWFWSEFDKEDKDFPPFN